MSIKELSITKNPSGTMALTGFYWDIMNFEHAVKNTVSIQEKNGLRLIVIKKKKSALFYWKNENILITTIQDARKYVVGILYCEEKKYKDLNLLSSIWMTIHVSVKKEFRGQDLGFKMYLTALAKLHKLISTPLDEMTYGSVGIWRKLAKKYSVKLVSTLFSKKMEFIPYKWNKAGIPSINDISIDKIKHPKDYLARSMFVVTNKS